MNDKGSNISYTTGIAIRDDYWGLIDKATDDV